MYSESSRVFGCSGGRDTIGPAPPKQPSPADAQGSSGIKTHVHTLNASHFTWVTAVCVHEVGKALSLEAPPCQKNATGIRRARPLYTSASARAKLPLGSDWTDRPGSIAAAQEPSEAEPEHAPEDPSTRSSFSSRTCVRRSSLARVGTPWKREIGQLADVQRTGASRLR